MDERKNEIAKGEAPLHAAGSRTHIWVVPTNEELVVARSVRQFLENSVTPRSAQGSAQH
jgi:acetate kinase